MNHFTPLKKTYMVLFMAACLFFAACSRQSAPVAWDLTDLTERLLSEITYTDTLDEMAPDLMSYLYADIDPADVVDQIIYISSGSTAEEIAAFEATDEEAAGRILSGLQTRIADQTDSFTDYVPAEVKRLEDAVLVQNGVYVILSVSGDPDTATEILKK